MAQQEDFAKKLCKKLPLLLMQENNEGNTPLHCALKSAHGENLFTSIMTVYIDKVRDLEEEGRRGFKANKNGESLLYLAANRESSKSVDLLLEMGVVAPDSVGPNGWTALHAAVFRKNKEIAESLLEKKPELNRMGDASGNTPFHYAVAYGDIEMVKKIINKNDDDIYLSNEDGHSALHVAAGLGNTRVVKLLVERSPGCVMLKDKKGRNALHVAVAADRRNVVMHMFTHPQFNGLTSDRDDVGNTPIHLAAINCLLMMVFIFVIFGNESDMSPMNDEGLTPLDIIYPDQPPWLSLLFPFRGKNGPCLYHLTKLLNEEGETAMVPGHANKTGSNSGKLEDDRKYQVKSGGKDDDRSNQGKRLNRFSNGLLLVATLIITVTFAAIITMPGGYVSGGNDTDGGTAVLAKRGSFKAFVILDTLAFICALRGAAQIIWTGGSEISKNVLDGQRLVLRAIMWMLLAFATGAYATRSISSLTCRNTSGWDSNNATAQSDNVEPF
ncbi:hypothetical protein QJS10_CPA09g01281 [Acorus calamus]|uniref:PGG domain-containing protein n=1 Tax=Acorus calamus TaxID=4465 RepID=A0AAV9E8T8_ACOCL|nr:hypothetical protein QJS10_CPA09g01281 [Acorus calamus]